MTEQTQQQDKHAAALAGFKEAAKEITFAQTQLEAAQKRIADVEQTSKAVLEELEFIQTQYPNLTIKTKNEGNEIYSSVYLKLSTDKSTEKTPGITGLKIYGANGSPVHIYLEVGKELSQSYTNTTGDIDKVIQKIANKAAKDDALAKAKQTPQTNKKAPTLAAFL